MPPRRRNTQDGTNQSQGAVYGPRSALTSFLREQGITGPGANVSYINRRQGTLRRTDSDGNDASPSGSSSPAPAAGEDDTVAVTTTVASTSTDADGSSVTVEASASTSTSRVASASTDANAEAGPSTASGSGSKRKGKALTAAQAKKKKAAEAADGEGDFILGGGAMPAPKKGRYEDRVPGQIKVCGECGKKFTVSKYTASNPRGKGLLCAPCTSESIEDRATFPAGVKGAKKAAPKKKKAEKALIEEKYTPVQTLQQSCLLIIASFISSVEAGAFSYLGSKNLDRIAKIVSKNRALDGDNLKLFLEVGHRELRLYDCTNLTDHALSTIASFTPHLHTLVLLQCGRLDDDTLTAWTPALKELKHLELYAPYLASAKMWAEFFEKRMETGGLETCRLRMSSRFNDLSLAALVAHNPSLASLQLSEMGKLTGDSLALLHPLGDRLTRLDISRLGTPQGTVLEDAEVVALLEKCGRGLSELVLDDNVNLTSTVLISGVLPHCRHLTSLSLSNLSSIDSDGLLALFDTSSSPSAREWASSGLTLLNCHRLHDALSPSVLDKILEHSGSSLRHLNLHSCDALLPELGAAVAGSAKELEVLDVSFIRAVDNFVVKEVLDGCDKLRVLFVHGNNRVTSDVPRKAGVQIRGLENAVHSEIPSGIMWEY
ncbi:hypothetical protein JCM10207_002798 [Rhodosporidiobolus poonsookiae]